MHFKWRKHFLSLIRKKKVQCLCKNFASFEQVLSPEHSSKVRGPNKNLSAIFNQLISKDCIPKNIIEIFSYHPKRKFFRLEFWAINLHEDDRKKCFSDFDETHPDNFQHWIARVDYFIVTHWSCTTAFVYNRPRRDI